MTNFEIIKNELEMKGIDFDYNGENLLTYAEWRKRGFQVQKGQKAFLTVTLWIPVQPKRNDSTNDKKQQKRRFILKKSYLFTYKQVKPIEQKEATTV